VQSAAVNIRQLLELATHQLTQSKTARLDAEILLVHALQAGRSFIYANPGLDLPTERRNEFLRLVRLRSEGRPIAYLTGQRSFWSLDLFITPAVLIPRPETELLVESALQRIPRDRPLRIADLGTGSGAIALAIAHERPACEIHATDCSLEALQLARENARRLGLTQVHFHHGSWAEPLEGEFDIVISNPPYVAADDPHLQLGDCRFEPRIALSPGADGLSALRQVAAEASTVLPGGGWLLLEHGHDQGEAVRSLLSLAAYKEISTVSDLNGIERICVGRKPSRTSTHRA
jgi:release factor glutamine methyltransferase